MICEHPLISVKSNWPPVQEPVLWACTPVQTAAGVTGGRQTHIKMYKVTAIAISSSWEWPVWESEGRRVSLCCKAEVEKMPISTKLTRALGIKHPLIQGGMHYVGYAPLVSISPQCFFLKPYNDIIVFCQRKALLAPPRVVDKNLLAPIGGANKSFKLALLNTITCNG